MNQPEPVVSSFVPAEKIVFSSHKASDKPDLILSVCHVLGKQVDLVSFKIDITFFLIICFDRIGFNMKMDMKIVILM